MDAAEDGPSVAFPFRQANPRTGSHRAGTTTGRTDSKRHDLFSGAPRRLLPFPPGARPMTFRDSRLSLFARRLRAFLAIHGPGRLAAAAWCVARGKPLSMLANDGRRHDPGEWACRPEDQGPPLGTASPVRTIAFYLPQFHPIAENDRWWGEGFTEWHNVARARPAYPGHCQPDLPGALGFYDLRLPETLRRQTELAAHHGLGGFCFHYYWFNKTRLLEQPLELFLADKRCDLPFCLNWANENWTRRWDGQEREILLRQHYSPEDDRAMMTDLLRYFADPRYIRVEGRPLLLVYHAGLLPDAAATLERWRQVCAAAGEKAPYCVMVQSFANRDPRPAGFEAAVQFPPHAAHLPLGLTTTRVAGISPGFRGRTIAYEELARQTLAGLDAPFPTFPCVCPGWDNTPRRGEKATIFVGATPNRYADWLGRACRHALSVLPGDRALVFVNAWNEWGEGAHLEPCRNWGYAFLNATTRTLARLAPASTQPGPEA